MNQLLYQDDESHPIPYLKTLDIEGDRKDGGLDLVIVIASPLGADERSLKRLVQKLRNYLGVVKDELERCEEKSIRIIVDINSESDSRALDYLEGCSNWIWENGAELVVRKVAR